MLTTLLLVCCLNAPLEVTIDKAVSDLVFVLER